MATIRPFRAFLYSDKFRTDLEDLIAPPYDVITPEEADLLRRNPHNITHLTLPTGRPGSDRYAEARQTLDEWIEERVLQPEPEPALYLYEQEFSDPRTGAATVRQGFITRLQLVEFGPGGVLPHERTLSRHREDRYRLRSSTRADLEPIFGMYPDSDIVDVLASAAATEPLISVTDRSGVQHRLWDVVDSEAISRAVDDLAGREVFIVDGHHRYITALEHCRKEGVADDHPLASIMIFLCSMENPGLVILPTHRIVHSIEPGRIGLLLERIADWFTVEELDTPESAFGSLRRKGTGVWYALLTGDRHLVVQPRESVIESIAANHPPSSPVAGLDVTILHEFLFERLLDISSEEQERGSNIRYSRNDGEAIAAVADDDVQLVVGMRSPSVSDVEHVASAGEAMPQKSTYFFPKLASGLLLNVDDDRTAGAE